MTGHDGEPMNEAAFWALIESARAEMTPELSNQAELVHERFPELAAKFG